MEKGAPRSRSPFKGRSGRNFRAKLKLTQNEEGKWRVDFDEEWAQTHPRSRRPPADGTEVADPSADGTGDAANGASRPPRRRRKAAAAQENFRPRRT